MRFTRRGKWEPTITRRKVAAYSLRLKREREKLPLFAAEVAAEQANYPSVDRVMEMRQAGARIDEIRWRRLAYLWWREARAVLVALPADLQNDIRARWQRGMYPGEGGYFMSCIRSWAKDAGFDIDAIHTPYKAMRVAVDEWYTEALRELHEDFK